MYNGLTIILSEASRHDKDRLISGQAGDFFWTNCLHSINRTDCVVETLDTFKSFAPTTKVVLLLGEPALKRFSTSGLSLNSSRGCPFLIENKLTALATYQPQDAFDRKSYTEEGESAPVDVEAATKDFSPTARKNWRWWMFNDLAKLRRIMKSGVITPPKFDVEIYADLTDVDKWPFPDKLVLDIETDKKLNLTCIGLGWPSEGIVKVIPVKKYNNELAYNKALLYRFLRWLSLVNSNPTTEVILHNAMFDLVVLTKTLKILPPKNPFDTMAAWQRCFPEMEKSLGHLGSYFTDLPYHKHEGVHEPTDPSSDYNNWVYNSKDIILTTLVAAGLRDKIISVRAKGSAEQVNRSIRPYLLMSLMGMKQDEKIKLEIAKEAKEKAIQMERCLRLVTRSNLNPRSPQQVTEYIYARLGFRKPEKDATKEETLLKLLTKVDPKTKQLVKVPSIKLILACRQLGKKASSLKFRNWSSVYGDNRVTCAYNITGTDTFRLGSRALLSFKRGGERGWGTNMQNWNKKIRKIIVAD